MTTVVIVTHVDVRFFLQKNKKKKNKKSKGQPAIWQSFRGTLCTATL
jgi:hypothetical protein